MKTKGISYPIKRASEEKQMGFSLMRAVALFLDGMSRALILPFGPSLVYRLVYGGTLKLGMDCAKVVFPLAVVVVAYLLGNVLGTSAAQKLSLSEESLPRYVARLAGITISLLVFTFGAGLKSVWWLVVIRFFTAVLVGILCFLTMDDDSPPPPEETSQSEEDKLESGLNLKNTSARSNTRRHSYLNFASGTAKIYTTAFAVSILSGGLLYRHATGDVTFQALTGSKQSLLFMGAVSITAESILRCVFAFCQTGKKNEDSSCPTAGNKIPKKLSKPLKPVTLNSKLRADESEALHSSSPVKSLDLIESNAPEVFVTFSDQLEATNPAGFSPLRSRLGTTESGEFFDCNSVLSDMDDMPLFDAETGECSAFNVAQYTDGKCIYPNGDPAHVPNGDSPDIVPENYLSICGGKKSKAEAMWKATQEWRRQQNVWRVHRIPHRWFPKIKKAYPHFIHGVSKRGYPIIYEQPGKMDLKNLFREGCDVLDMVKHYIFFLECISNRICTKEEVRSRMGLRPPPHSSSSWGIMVAMDVKGAGLSHLSGDVLTYLKSAGDINNAHYPLSLKRAFVIKSPFWLAGAWKSIKGILPESVHVDILSSHNYLAALREYIDDDQIPQEYGGSSPYKLGEHPFELELCRLVEESAENAEDTLEDNAMEGDLKDEMPCDLPPQSTYSFDHNTKTRSTETDGLTIEDGAPHMNTIDSPTRSGLHPRRRRAMSTDRSNLGEKFVASDNDGRWEDEKKGHVGAEAHIFIVVTAMYALWSAIQGVIETAIPLWILIPPELGGLGYAPSRSGVALFCSAIVLLWVMRTKVSKVIAKIPSKAPMRSFRIGVGAESVLLFLLATVPKSIRYVSLPVRFQIEMMIVN